MRVGLGNEALLADPVAVLRDQRVGLVANPTSFTGDLRGVARVLAEHPGVDLRVIFAPEHGLFGAAQDMESVGSTRFLGRPVVSLYGSNVETLKPSLVDMDEIDVLVVDLQDIGTRYYTFVWTAVLCLRAAARTGKSVVVCDRPNPLGGEVVSGPMIEPGYESFVGLCNVPVRHGMTIGELMRWAKREEGLDLDLTILPLRGWNRSAYFDETGLPWIPPSPNMPTLATAVVYPGACLIEGTTLSEGRGTTTPFELVGAPGVEGQTLADALNTRAGDACRFRPVVFRPGFQKHRRRECGGVFCHVLDRHRVDALTTYMLMISAVRSLFPHSFAWRDEAYEFVQDRPAIDLLCGGPSFREAVESGADIADVTARFRPDDEFMENRRRSLLY